jgi:hypothetical protein
MTEFSLGRYPKKKTPKPEGKLKGVVRSYGAGVEFLKSKSKQKKKKVNPYDEEAFIESELQPRYSALEKRVAQEKKGEKRRGGR